MRRTKATIIKSVTHCHVGFSSKTEEKRYQECCNLVYKLLSQRISVSIGRDGQDNESTPNN